MADPDNNFLEGNKANNVTDVKIRFSGNTVSVLDPLANLGSIVVDQTVTRDGVGPVSTAGLSTSGPDELLVAFVASGGPQGQTVSVSGGGLAWSLARRANAQPGTGEVWVARAPAPLSAAVITSTPATGGYAQSLTVIALKGASGLGATVAAGGTSGAATATLTTTGAGSAVFGVGGDADQSIYRALGPGQVMVHESLDQNRTLWLQARSAATGVAGSVVAMNTTRPVGGRWNEAAVEVLSA